MSEPQTEQSTTTEQPAQTTTKDYENLFWEWLNHAVLQAINDGDVDKLLHVHSVIGRWLPFLTRPR